MIFASYIYLSHISSSTCVPFFCMYISWQPAFPSSILLRGSLSLKLTSLFSCTWGKPILQNGFRFETAIYLDSNLQEFFHILSWDHQPLFTYKYFSPNYPQPTFKIGKNLPFGIFWVVFREGNSLELKAANKFGKWMEWWWNNQPFLIHKGLVHSSSKCTQLLLASCFKHCFSTNLTWGDDPIWLYNMFQMGWFNHHRLDNCFSKKIGCLEFQEFICLPYFGLEFFPGLDYRVIAAEGAFRWDWTVGKETWLAGTWPWNEFLVEFRVGFSGHVWLP